MSDASPLNPNTLVLFREPAGLSTTDLGDAHGRIVQFDQRWRSHLDARRHYKISGLVEGTGEVAVSKQGYQSQSRQVDLNGDVRFDIQLVRR